MSGFNEKLTAAIRLFGEAKAQEELVRIVFPEESSTGVATRRKKAAMTARRLLKKLNASIEKVQEPRSNEDVTAIVEQADSSRRGVRERWQALMKKKLAPYEKLVEVACNLALSGSRELADVMERLGGAVSQQPPTAERKAEAIRDELEELRLSVQHLGFDDELVRKFLVDAAAGTAALKVPLDEPSVREFLNKHKLWTLFRVSTR